MLAFIRYIEVHFTFGLLDCARCNEDFVISRFCSIHFTVTLAGLKSIVRYTEDFVILTLVRSRFRSSNEISLKHEGHVASPQREPLLLQQIDVKLLENIEKE